MKLIKPQYQIITQKSGLEGLYKQIELCGRVAYKSEDRITEDSYKGFVDKMIKLNHGAVLEHGTIYLDFTDNIVEARNKYTSNPYSKIYKNTLEENWNYPHLYVTTNMRVLVEHNWLEDLKYLCAPTEYHEKRICVRLICDRGILAEFTRHRSFSFIAESTRYCNYSKNKFNNEVTFITPPWVELNHYNVSIDSVGNNEVYIDGKEESLYNVEDTASVDFLYALKAAEDTYFSLLKAGWQPQQARAVLPNALKTELIMTGFISDWKHFFKLRCAGSAHPQAKELAVPLQKEFLTRGYL